MKQKKTVSEGNEQQDLTNDELVAKVKGFFLATQNLSTQAKEAETTCC